jgi:biopolymer transport protein ExbB
MKNYLILPTAALTALMFAGPTAAQTDAMDIDELLERVRQGSARDNQAEAARLRAFEQNQGQQERLLQEARNERAAEERRSDQLETTFESNELLIADVTAQLDSRLGSLRELFGVLQQVAGDARAQFENSFTNVEFPDRAQFLGDLAAKMGSSSELASIAEIERLWFELQREATEQGKVKRIPNYRVITSSGQESYEDVVRIGTFNVVAAGRYLSHNPDTNSLSELQRQPSEGRFTGSTSALLAATPGSGFVRFGLDPTSGVILSSLVQSPNLRERINQGGIVGYVIIALGLLAVLLSAERLFTLTIASQKVKAQLKNPDNPSNDNALGRVLQVYQSNREVDTETLELKLGEAILRETPALQRGILFIKVISVVAPLLGLLGTVTGMINTFQAITLFGTGDPKTMAGGISQALVTTVLGLTVAIPTVLLHTIVSGRSKTITQVLQEQTAGIVAQQSERSSR